MNIRVTNKKSDLSDCNVIYIGRLSVLGNPFSMKTENDRARVILEYREWLSIEMRKKAKVHNAVHELARKAKHEDLSLQCWCSPKACHSDVLKEVIESINQRIPMKRLVVDISNIFWRSVSAMNKYGPQDGGDKAGLGLHGSLMSLRKHYNAIKPNKLAIVFEGKQNWRKEYTKSAECVSQRLYKGNRVADPEMAVLFDVMRAFEDLARQHTNIVTLQHPELEGDDLISGYALHYAALGDEVTILSGDKDFVQLLGDPLITLINPDDGKPRSLVGVCDVDDAGYFMFEKCFRGDAGDNVLPALPRVRKTKLYKAYGVKDGKVDPMLADSFEMSNLLNSTWDFVNPETGEKRVISVEDMYVENSLLMNLTGQPPEIKKLITAVIEHESENHGQFNFFKFNAFLGKYKLQQIADKASDFVPMFSGTGFKQMQAQEPVKVNKTNDDKIAGMSF
jgi:hypothetical protein